MEKKLPFVLLSLVVAVSCSWCW